MNIKQFIANFKKRYSKKHYHEWVQIGFTRHCIVCELKQHFVQNPETKQYDWTDRKMNHKNGWTLIETMIVLTIIILLTAVAIPAFLKAKDEAQKKQRLDRTSTVEKDREGIVYRTVKIDNCEYLDNEVGNGHVYTHKGNCLNPFHAIK